MLVSALTPASGTVKNLQQHASLPVGGWLILLHKGEDGDKAGKLQMLRLTVPNAFHSLLSTPSSSKRESGKKFSSYTIDLFCPHCVILG